jgi:hypothetical protein
MANNPGKPDSDPINSRTLYSVQRRAERPTLLFYMLLGLASSSRKALQKLSGECSSSSDLGAGQFPQGHKGEDGNEIEVEDK